MYFLSFALLFLKWPDIKAADSVQLMSTNDNFMSVISGFTVRLQCSVYRCNEEKPTVAWYKDELLIFNGSDFQLTSGIDPSNILLQLTAAPEQGQKCATDEYTLLLRNITLRDAGKYRCELHRRLQQLDFQIDVLENGLKPGFNKNIDFDVTACCIEQGISPLCRPMCKPKEMDLEFFDPTSCKTKDFKGFLYCATNGGKTDFIPCCKQKSVPSFCFDFCSFNFSMLKRSHRLCLYYLPELLQCFSQKQSRPPKAPSNLQIRRARHKLLCWKEVDSEDSPIEYSVHVREVPLLSIPADENLRKQPLPKPRPKSGRRHERAVKQKLNVIVAHDSAHSDQTDILRLDQDQIEQRNGSLCISLAGLRRSVRYVFYVQATNENGMSEPSAALFEVL